MLKKLASLLILGSLLTGSAFTDDFLAKVSKGALSDNSQGVKTLNFDEMKEIKGGYRIIPMINGMEMYAIAKYEQEELQYMANYLKGNINAPQGLCGIDQSSCSNPSKNRFISFLQITQNSLSTLPVYMVKRQVKVSDLGKPYVLFTYGVGAYDTQTQQMYKFNSSLMLNNNMIIKEMANKYKEQMETVLGRYTR